MQICKYANIQRYVKIRTNGLMLFTKDTAAKRMWPERGVRAAHGSRSDPTGVRALELEWGGIKSFGYWYVCWSPICNS